MELPPRKPMPAYLLWFVEHREKLASETEVAGARAGAALGRLAGQRWKAMSQAAKGPFEERAAQLRASYERDLEAFKARAGEAGRKRQRESEEAGKGAIVKKAAPAATDPERPAAVEKPKKPQNAYWLWFAHHREALFKEFNGVSACKVSKRAGERWKALSALERAPYVKKAQEMKAVYDRALDDKTVKTVATSTGAPMLEEKESTGGGNVPMDETE